MQSEKIIATFSCQPTIHVYKKGCGFIPHPPCRYHDSIKEAKKFMKEMRGIDDPEIIVNKKHK